jgi:dihydropteroate synthase
MVAVQRGAMIVRVHDVAATRDALAVWQAVHAGDAPVKAAPKSFGSQRFGDD